MASTTMQPHRQIYNSVVQSCPEPKAVKSFLIYPKCEQVLQKARRSHYSTNPEHKSAAAEMLMNAIPSLSFLMEWLNLRINWPSFSAQHYFFSFSKVISSYFIKIRNSKQF